MISPFAVNPSRNAASRAHNTAQCGQINGGTAISKQFLAVPQGA
jgi:hypothetical protein